MMSILASLFARNRRCFLSIEENHKVFCCCAMLFHSAKAGAYPSQTSESGNHEGSSNLYRVAVVEQDSTNQWRPTGTQDDSSFIHLSPPNVRLCAEFLPL